MAYDLKVKKSYHEDEGYKYKLYNSKGKKIGELRNFPFACQYVDTTVLINGEMYIIDGIYESKNPKEEKKEVVYYELLEYEYRPHFDLGEIKTKKTDC